MTGKANGSRIDEEELYDRISSRRKQSGISELDKCKQEEQVLNLYQQSICSLVVIKNADNQTWGGL